MARIKDAQKRDRILTASKYLFSKSGFANTSVSDIVDGTKLPVGTIYTYFKKKEDIIITIVQEGWDEFVLRLEQLARSEKSGIDKLRIIIDRIIPELFEDLELINILLTEAIMYTRIEEKLERITDFIMGIMKEIPEAAELTRKMMRTAIVVFFLGILNSANLAEAANTDVTLKDISEFMKHTISQFVGQPL